MSKLNKNEVQEAVDGFVNSENAIEIAKTLLAEKYGKMDNKDGISQKILSDFAREMNITDVYSPKLNKDDVNDENCDELKLFKYLYELTSCNQCDGKNIHINKVNGKGYTTLKSGKLVDKYDSFINVVVDIETDEILKIDLEPRTERIEENMKEAQIIEEYDTCSQDQINAFESQEESIQEKIEQLNGVVENECKSEIYRLPVMVTTTDSDCDEREFINGENCRILSFDIFNGALVLNIGLEPIDTIITRDMCCSNDAIIVFKSDDEEIETFEMSIANIINSGLGCWYSYKNEVMYLSPLEWRGMSKLFI